MEEKTREYYESLDKRTTEYKQWKKEQEQKKAFVEAAFDQEEEFQQMINDYDIVAPEILDDPESEETFEGLGDAIEAFTTATGIKKAVKWIFGEDCGCEERKEKLNKLFPFAKSLTEEEFDYLTVFFEKKTSVISSQEQRELLSIFNRVFNARVKATSCSKCFLNNVYKKLLSLHDAYKVDGK
jgi:hypothetical protein